MQSGKMLIRSVNASIVFLFTIFKLRYCMDTDTDTNIKCHTDINFQHLHGVDDIYNFEPHECNSRISDVCRKFQNLRISFFEMQPFTMKDPRNSNSLTSGIIQHIMHIAFTECCGKCMDIKDTRVYNHTWLSNVHSKNRSDIRFPVFSDQHYRCNSNIIPLMKLSGAVFIIKSAVAATKFGNKVFSAIVAIWPLLGLSILLAYASGVIMWFVDTWSNKDHFPRRFLTGSFEGFWWSFISMTTVGYGDRAPKSVPAKLFACFWILCGITIISLLTAALTTAIDTVNKELRPSIEHGCIGILKNHLFEKSILLRGNAKIVTKENMEELSHALNQGEIQGMLIDSFTIKSLDTKILVNDNLYIDKVINDQGESYIGVVVDNKELFKLLYDYIDYQKDSIRDFVHRANPQLDEGNDMAEINANIIFTTKSGIFYPMLVIAGAIILNIIVIGIIYEIYRKKRKKVLVHSRSLFKLTPNNLRKEEEKMEQKLNDILCTWDKDLLQLINNYTIHGIFTNSNSTYPNVMIKLQTKLASTSFAMDAENDNIVKEKSTHTMNGVSMNGTNYKKFTNESFDIGENGKNSRKMKKPEKAQSCEIELGEPENKEDEEMGMYQIKRKKKKKKKNSSNNGNLGNTDLRQLRRPLPPISQSEEA